jgi:hypothetical protein
VDTTTGATVDTCSGGFEDVGQNEHAGAPATHALGHKMFPGQN